MIACSLSHHLHHWNHENPYGNWFSVVIGSAYNGYYSDRIAKVLA
ncbi:MAG: hypothetical protein AAGF83_03080 [Cyanobacteria bacterium P01_G01_bin.67]